MTEKLLTGTLSLNTTQPLLHLPILSVILLCDSAANVLILTSDNEFWARIYSLFRGRQNIFLTLFNTKFVVKCAKKIEYQLTKTEVMSKNIFE